MYLEPNAMAEGMTETPVKFFVYDIACDLVTFALAFAALGKIAARGHLRFENGVVDFYLLI